VNINSAATVSKEPKTLTESPLDAKAPVQASAVATPQYKQ
jgi:hypothetical protein